MSYSGVALTTGQDYDPWHGAFGANFVNVADDVADAGSGHEEAPGERQREEAEE